MRGRIRFFDHNRNCFSALMDMSDIFTGWYGVRVLLYVGLAGSLLSIGQGDFKATLLALRLCSISIWQMTSFFQLPKNISESDGLNALGLNNDWATEICHTYPYALFSPISFKWSYLGESGGLAVCPWPSATSIYRIALGGSTILINTFALSFGISTTRHAGQVVFPVLMLTWYSAFVVDLTNLIQAYTLCINRFPQSNLGDKMSRVLSLNVVCSYGPSTIPVGINLFMFAIVLLIARHWSSARSRIEENTAEEMLKRDVKEDDIILF